jgi:peptide/nickel transport system substrate-binding protein
LIQEQLRRAGVLVRVEQLDAGAMGARMMAHTFDAAMGGLTATPSPSGVRQTWTSTAATEGGFNFGRYESPAFDAQVDSALEARTQARAKRHYRAAYQTIVDDAPAIWLYEPPMLAGASRRLQLGVVRPDAWWLGLTTWSIAPVK